MNIKLPKLLKRMASLMLAFLFSTGLMAVDKSGTISSSETWSGNINIIGNVTLSSGVTLTIDPGTTIDFGSSDYYIQVNDGAIINAIGAVGDSIRFTGTGWDGIRFGDGASSGYASSSAPSDTNTFFFCVFENADYQNVDWGGGAIGVTKGDYMLFHAKGCRFSNNTSVAYGGACHFWSDGEINQESIVFENCHFNGNTGAAGGALSSYRAKLRVLNSSFVSNQSVGHAGKNISGTGGAIYLSSGTDVAIIDPQGGDGKGNFLYVDNCIFESNSVTYNNASGGAIFASQQPANGRATIGTYVEIYNSEFNNNSSAKAMGAVEVKEAEVTIQSCTFENNSANAPDDNGISGALEIMDCTIDISRCTFLGNSSDNSNAGAVRFASNDGSCTGTVDRCWFESNTAKNSGGAIAIGASPSGSSTNVDITNCVFTQNMAHQGGAITVQNQHSRTIDVEIYGNTFYKNKTDGESGAGGSAIVTDASTTKIIGNVFCQDSSQGGTVVSTSPPSPAPICDYNVFTGDVNYIIGTDPSGSIETAFSSFENNQNTVALSSLGFNNYPDSVVLTTSSTALVNQIPDDHAIVSKLGSNDYYGKSRVQNDALDIGASEFGGEVVTCPEIGGTYPTKKVSVTDDADTLTITCNITHSDTVTFKALSSSSTVVTASVISGTNTYILTPGSVATGQASDTSTISLIVTPDPTNLPNCSADTVTFLYILEMPKPEASGIEGNLIVAKTDTTTVDTLIVSSDLDGVTLSAELGTIDPLLTDYLTFEKIATKASSVQYKITINPTSEDFPEDETFTGQTINMTDDDNSITEIYTFTVKIDFVTSISDDLLASDISISPNPGSGLFQITSDLDAVNVAYQVIGLSGTVLKTGVFEELTSQELDLSGLGSGMYLLKLDIDGAPVSFRLIIQ